MQIIIQSNDYVTLSLEIIEKSGCPLSEVINFCMECVLNRFSFVERLDCLLSEIILSEVSLLVLSITVVNISGGMQWMVLSVVMTRQ